MLGRFMMTSGNVDHTRLSVAWFSGKPLQKEASSGVTTILLAANLSSFQREWDIAGTVGTMTEGDLGAASERTSHSILG